MTKKQYRIDNFIGLNQSQNENSLNSCFSFDACNMNTDNGNLRVASGYVRHIENPVPGTRPIYRMTTFTGSDGILQYIVLTDTEIYASRGSTWTQIYSYGSRLGYCQYDFTQAKIGSADYLLIGCGESQIVKYDGETASLFGSKDKLSDKSVRYLDMYKNRLFSAGDPLFPNRLYWSQLPGDDRSIEDWGYYEASVNVEGGHTDIGSTGNDPIVAIRAMSNQILIFKQHSLYRLIGDKPSNFTVEKLDAQFRAPAHTAIVPYNDSLVFITKDGLSLFNGVTVHRLSDAKFIEEILSRSFTSNSKSTYCNGKFYFSICENVYYLMNALIEYDPLRHSYMIRRGFYIDDLHTVKNTVLLLNSERYIYRFNEGSSYDGKPIEAWWKTPRTDLLNKTAVKALRTLAFSGNSENDSRVIAEVSTDKHTDTYALQLTAPDNTANIIEFPLKNEGRNFSLKFKNENGGSFVIDSGVELLFEEWRRTE